MYKIMYVGDTREQIGSFVQSILKKNLSIFEDTGIFSEALIQQNYVTSADVFHESIIDEIEKVGTLEIIGGLHSETAMYFTVRMKSFFIFIEYSEDRGSKIRYIENIEFFRK